MPLIVAITGYSGTGKSLLARTLAERLGAPLIPVGEVMREHAKAQGYEGLRHYFRLLGARKAFEQARPLVLKRILVHGMKPLVVVDGLYDPRLKEELAQQHHRMYLLNVAAPRSLRVLRIATREQISKAMAKKEARLRDRLKLEAGMLEILKQSNYAIRNRAQLDQMHQEVLEKIRGFEERLR
jgi:dephospho-CoA kinase